MLRSLVRAEAREVNDAPSRPTRRIAYTAASVLLSLAVYFAVSLIQVWLMGRDDSFARSNTRVDAVVVLGAAQYDGRPSPQFAARLDHALLLWQRGLADSVVVTGGKQIGDRFTEAESGRDYLVTRGVPVAAVQVEPRGSSTFTSLESVARELGNRRVVLVREVPALAPVGSQRKRRKDHISPGLPGSDDWGQGLAPWAGKIAVLVTTLDPKAYPARVLARLYRERADAENIYDELKNQWGWG
ncbi:MAG: YdcF family protein, partial [Actinobacteria bacterium]|nr:YdcF family protein [Actinomycetota bacterium]